MMCHRTFKLSLQQISLVLLTCLPAPLYFFNLLLSRLLFAEKWHASISSFFPWIYFFRVCLCICVCRDQSSLLVLGRVNMFFKKDAVTLKQCQCHLNYKLSRFKRVSFSCRTLKTYLRSHT